MGLNARSIGLRIQQARVAKGMTQGELAKALGIDRGSVGRWETGRSVPRQVGIPKVAKLLGQSPDWLLEGSGDLSPALDNVEVLRTDRRVLKEIREEVKKLGRRSSTTETSASLADSMLSKGTAKNKKTDHSSPGSGSLENMLREKMDRLTLEDILAGWNSAKPEARLIAALLVTGDWTYKLKLMNREVAVDEEVLSLLGKITA